MHTCCVYFVSGRVQGVFFRATTAREARRLGLTGHAINLPDGRVEVLACGEGVSVEELGQWLWQGSPASEVRSVRREDYTGAAPPRFTTG